MLILHCIQQSDDAEEEQEKSRIAARAAEIALEKAAQEVAGPYTQHSCTVPYEAILFSTLHFSAES